MKRLHNFIFIMKDWLVKPFTTNLSTFSLIFAGFLLFVMAYLYSGNRGIGIISINIFVAYLLTLIVSLFPIKVRKYFLITVIIYLGLISLLSYSGSIFIKNPQAMNTLMLILQTNSEETTEFIETYLSIKNVLMLFFGVLLLVIIPVIFKWQKYIVSKLRYILLSLCIFCGGIIILSPSIVFVTPLFCVFEKDLMSNFIIADLTDYIEAPKIKSVSDVRPSHVVMILGESLSKSHCSLYEYDRMTQPNLCRLEDDGFMSVFKSVTSPTTGTGTAFQHIMSTYCSRDENVNWLSCQTLPTIMKNEHYETYWLSNQASMGLLDAIPNMYSKLFDEIHFSSGENTLDEILIPMVKSQIDTLKNQFMVVHLMGNHESFSKRYSSNFNKFTLKDYNDKPKHQQQILAEYDNSVLYNDYVVSQIIELFKEEDAVVVYFPDHGLDVFESDETYFGHSLGTEKSQYVGKQIPFMIYVSENYQKQNTKILQQLQSAITNKFCTQDVLYLIMDITGYKFVDSDDVRKYSPLHCLY